MSSMFGSPMNLSSIARNVRFPIIHNYTDSILEGGVERGNKRRRGEGRN